MKIHIAKKYLIFPVNALTAAKKMRLKKGKDTVYDLNIRLDNMNPTFYAYIDVERFMGENLEISVEPEMKLQYRVSDEMDIDGLYEEPMRPQIHFTARNGWLNDPNGLLYMEGVYHMFFQHNPAGPHWANMQWGHAVSKDLLHWTEEDIALFPDDRGAMFSGSAIIDEGNLLGLNTEDKKAAVLFYTTTEPFCQNLSYSLDGFKTIEHYSANPVVPHMEGQNRDPKVIFCEELGCYIMALFLQSDYCILKSEDLVHWEKIQTIHLQDDSECPDIFPLTDENGTRKWVFMGASDRYVVGSFEKGKFVAEQSTMSLHYGASAYAGQSFSNLPFGRVVRMVWNRWKLPADRFNGQMGIPMELSLAEWKGTYYVEASPVKEIEGISRNTVTYENVEITAGQDFVGRLEDAPYLVRIKGPLYTSGKVEINIFGRKICLNFDKNEWKAADCKGPISITGKELDLTVIVDRCSMELFLDNGKTYASFAEEYAAADRNIPYIILHSDTTMKVGEIELHALCSIW